MYILVNPVEKTYSTDLSPLRAQENLTSIPLVARFPLTG